MKIFIYRMTYTDLQTWRLEPIKETVNYKFICTAEVEKAKHDDWSDEDDNPDPNFPPNTGEFGKVYMGPFVKIVSINPSH
jgi:hypothetical protein